ncbi:MAG: hypothetical protein AABW64_00775 [Nanoarchaeota archaeon]
MILSDDRANIKIAQKSIKFVNNPMNAIKAICDRVYEMKLAESLNNPVSC